MTTYKCTHSENQTVHTGNGTRLVCLICGAVGLAGGTVEWFFEPEIESTGYNGP